MMKQFQDRNLDDIYSQELASALMTMRAADALYVDPWEKLMHLATVKHQTLCVTAIELEADDDFQQLGTLPPDIVRAQIRTQMGTMYRRLCIRHDLPNA